MILQFLAPIGAFLKRVPWQVYAALAIILTAWAWGNHRYSEGVADNEAKHAEIARKAAEKARKADGVARDTVDGTKGRIEAENDAARKAAEGSDDPLRDAMRSLAEERKP